MINDGKRSLWADAISILLLILLAWFVARPSLHRLDVDGLDSAHHLMDGYFFYDLFHDRPTTHLEQYVFNYYKQYPALGFVFWPPLFPFILGIFCLGGGAHVLTARVCLLFFGALFGSCFYLTLRRYFSPPLALAAACSALAVPGISWSLNQVMLELPTLAMICVAILAYQEFVDKLATPSSAVRAALCGAAFAAVVYTKQPGYFIYGAFLFDFLLLHRRYLRKPETWMLVASTALFCIPLLLFTLKFGHADLAQSVGSNTQLILGSQWHGIPRWSLAAWTYYPRLAPSSLNLVVVGLSLCALLLGIAKRRFLVANALWFGWFLLAYVTFSYYDNRLPRHSTFWWPAWVALAAAALQFFSSRLPKSAAAALPLLLLLPLPYDLAKTYHRNYTDFLDERPPVNQMFSGGSPGNVLLFGKDKQVFISLIREDDIERRVHVIRGDDLIAGGKTIDDLCRSYRIGTVMIEVPANTPLSSALDSLRSNSQFVPERMSVITRAHQPYQIVVYRYTGPIAAQLADVPLSSRLM
ncbi:glycosyltransferase family 39 protein [Acidipila rosea]|uniref:Dolichyl-phosphate-mannose-protein mannosyltransferase n=1 Tax=Acidipila rosea TaxID=768535 RepID=A0A4R1LB06_9BACT|nr:glycosyltransferase family 39 protein [Acidipila rosea]MBW4027402.1 hypothetical protein [Acidobacteriota bacterium]TCK75525.1 dolichyl-phosphate-mannose-protein mannosyltransferase [Acidipila rosea]